MPKHGGCFICGGGHDEILSARPVGGIQDVNSVALCKKCFEMDDRTLRLKVRQIEEIKMEALRKAREAANA